PAESPRARRAGQQALSGKGWRLARLPDGARCDRTPGPTLARDRLRPTARRPAQWPKGADDNGSWRSLLHPHFAEHASFHVVEQVAVIGPAAEGIGSHPVAALGAWRHVDGVFAHHEIARFVLQIAPEAMEVDRMRH